MADDAGRVTVTDEPVGDGTLRWLTLDRPAQHNPLDHATVRRLRALLEAADTAPEVVAVAVTGRGRAFSAGGDLKGYQQLYADEPRFRSFLDDFAVVCRLLELGRFVSLAAVNGTCVAGGLELILACDLVVAGRSARIGDGHLTFGQLPGAGGSQRLVRAIGPVRARRWLLQASLYEAEVALADGVVTEVVEDELLETRIGELAAACAGHSPLAVQHMKQLVDIAQHRPLTDGLDAERELVIGYATTSHDAREGLEAFADRRTPRWTGT